MFYVKVTAADYDGTVVSGCTQAITAKANSKKVILSNSYGNAYLYNVSAAKNL